MNKKSTAVRALGACAKASIMACARAFVALSNRASSNREYIELQATDDSYTSADCSDDESLVCADAEPISACESHELQDNASIQIIPATQDDDAANLASVQISEENQSIQSDSDDSPSYFLMLKSAYLSLANRRRDELRYPRRAILDRHVLWKCPPMAPGLVMRA